MANRRKSAVKIIKKIFDQITSRLESLMVVVVMVFQVRVSESFNLSLRSNLSQTGQILCSGLVIINMSFPTQTTFYTQPSRNTSNHCLTWVSFYEGKKEVSFNVSFSGIKILSSMRWIFTSLEQKVEVSFNLLDISDICK